MNAFINLQRCFRDLTTAELENPEILASLNERGLSGGAEWPDLLRHARVIVLAEAGAGKTREMLEQAKHLTAEGKFGFFVALESLDREPLANILSPAEEAQFTAWKEDREAPAWFFLDAVDELKLTEGKLDRALLRFSKSVGGDLDRARVIISCRPNDWRPSIDLLTLQARLPVTERVGATAHSPADEVFINALRGNHSGSNSVGSDDDLSEASSAVRTVILLPMSERQIKFFAEQSGIGDASAFLAEVARQNAWTFARRPLDLAELIATWVSSGHLGTRAEQHEANTNAKLRDPNRPDRDILTCEKTRLGAERLALALALTRTRTLRSPDQALDFERSEGVLDPATILPDWTEAERQALLRRALFDPATYGRVRFHHRSVQEYLAAQRLKTLYDKGMSTKALFRLLFANRYGIDVVFPSMRAIAAWLALWNASVRRELTRREPETLLSFGDPETLDLAGRRDLIRAFVEAYGNGGSRGLNIPIDEVRRLAHPELAPLIRELWGSGPVNTDVRELLIEMIWQGPIEGCVDLAHAAALDMDWHSYQRVVAIRALVVCNQDEKVRQVVHAMLSQAENWPDRVISGVAADLFPRTITVDELATLMQRIHGPGRSVEGISWAAMEIVAQVEPWSEHAIALRDKMTDLIWEGRDSEQEFYRIHGKFDHFTPALATLCERQLAAVTSNEADPLLIFACVVASRFTRDESGQRDSIGRLKAQVQVGVELRSTVFWAELALMDQMVPGEDDWHRYYHVECNSLLGPLTEFDRPWLETAVEDERSPERRGVALYALIQEWYARGRDDDELTVLRSMLKGDTNLESILAERTAPPRDDKLEEMRRESDRLQRANAAREAARLQKWIRWRDELIANPTDAFTDENQSVTLRNLYYWLEASSQKISGYNVWNKAAVLQAFGVDVANQAEKTFQKLWRQTTPQLWSARAPEERNSTPYVWLYGLCGVSAEACTPGWAESLTSAEASIAAAYATVELNGFAPFISDLVASHPEQLDAVIGAELSAEISVAGDHRHLPILQDLSYADINLKRLLAQRLIAALQKYPRSFADEIGSHLTHHLDQILRILGETAGDVDRRRIAAECTDGYRSDPTGPLGFVWLKGLFRAEAEHGTEVLVAELAAADGVDAHKHAVAMFASLFGDRDAVSFHISEPANRARALGQLLRCAYFFIRPEEDQVHEGCYSPDVRDHAESARNFLLSALLDTPGPDAQRVVLELSLEPEFAHFPDRLRMLARERTAQDAEFPAFSSEAVVILDNRNEVPPNDRDGLFAIMVDRLDDLAHDVAHHDFTDRRTLRSITEEVEMQRTLALRLDANANGAFLVTREDEVADQKRTDIRLSAVRGGQKAVVEVKIADERWSLSDLQRALNNQLVGQYLRHSICKAGCLLLTYDGKKRYWVHPDSKKHLKFHDMVAFLNEKAKELEVDSQYEIRLSVFGLDLTDPVLPPAHR
jgi:hypothetical protein